MDNTEFQKIFYKYDDIDQPIDKGDFSIGFNAAIEHYNDKIYDLLKELVELKRIKDSSSGKTQEYYRRQPHAWAEAKKIIKEIEEKNQIKNNGSINMQ